MMRLKEAHRAQRKNVPPSRMSVQYKVKRHIPDVSAVSKREERRLSPA
jgi:hypothetical protein